MSNPRIPGVDGESTIKDDLKDAKEGLKSGVAFAGGFAGDEEKREEKRAEREAANFTPSETVGLERTNAGWATTGTSDVTDDEFEAQEAEQGVGFRSS